MLGRLKRNSDIALLLAVGLFFLYAGWGHLFVYSKSPIALWPEWGAQTTQMHGLISDQPVPYWHVLWRANELASFALLFGLFCFVDRGTKFYCRLEPFMQFMFAAAVVDVLEQLIWKSNVVFWPIELAVTALTICFVIYGIFIVKIPDVLKSDKKHLVVYSDPIKGLSDSIHQIFAQKQSKAISYDEAIKEVNNLFTMAVMRQGALEGQIQQGKIDNTQLINILDEGVKARVQLAMDCIKEYMDNGTPEAMSLAMDLLKKTLYLSEEAIKN